MVGYQSVVTSSSSRPITPASPLQTTRVKAEIVDLSRSLLLARLGSKAREEKLKPSVKIAWGEKNFQTAVKSDAPG